MPSRNIIENSTVTFFPEENRLEVHTAKEKPWQAANNGNPMLMPAMYGGLIQDIAHRDQQSARAGLFRQTLKLLCNHHGKYAEDEKATIADWDNSPYFHYKRQGGDLIWKLTDSELWDHIHLVFVSTKMGEWPRALIIPAYDTATALQKATITTNSPYGIGLPLKDVVTAIEEYEHGIWKKNKTPSIA